MKIKAERLLTFTGYALLIAGFVLFVNQLKEGDFKSQLGYVLSIVGLGVIIAAYEILARKLKSENHKLHKENSRIKEELIGGE